MKAYNHTQTTPAATWTINHNLNTEHVTIDVIDQNTQKEVIIPYKKVIVDANTLELTFTSPRAGYCRIVGQNI